MSRGISRRVIDSVFLCMGLVLSKSRAQERRGVLRARRLIDADHAGHDANAGLAGPAGLHFDTGNADVPESRGACTIEAGALAGVLRSHAIVLGADRHEAEDLAQETIVRILARAPEKQGHVGYATCALTRLWLDRQRTLRVRAARLRRLAAGAIVGSAPPHLSDDSRSAIVFGAIRSLAPKQRAALVLRLVEGLGYAAIAEAIGCSEEAARASLHEARARLRKELMRRGIEP